MKHFRPHFSSPENSSAEWPKNLVLTLLSMNDITEVPTGDLTARVNYLTGLLPHPDGEVVMQRYRDRNAFSQIAENLSLPSDKNACRRHENALIRLSDPVYVDILLTGNLPSAEDWSAHSVSERFPTNTANRLHRMGVHTLVDLRWLLTNHSVDDLLYARGFGEKMHSELLAFSRSLPTNDVPQKQS